MQPLRPPLARLGLGCARIGSFNNPQRLSEAQALIEAALAMGVSVLDTSNIYGQGDSEAVIGRAVRASTAPAFIVTKAGRGFSPKMRALRPLKPLLRPLLAARAAAKGGAPAPATSVVTQRREAELRMDWSPAALTNSLHGSLKRLGVERVDGFLLHSPPAAVAARGDVAETLAAACDAGKLAHFGVSCDDVACLEAALTMPGLSLLQLPWDVIAAVRGTPAAEAITARGIGVFAREVIRLQPGQTPEAAVRAALAEPLVSTVLVGTTKRRHLEALAALA